MAQFQLLRCSVAIDNDRDHVVVRHRSNPILFPELPVLEFLHGEGSITDIHVVGTCEMSQDDALTRLKLIYPEDALKQVFPGARPRLPLGDQSIPICTKPVHKPKPTTPDNPDPKLIPLDRYTISAAAETSTDDMPGFDAPTPYEDDDIEEALDPGVDQELLNARPRVEDLPQTRTGFRGQARQARQTPSTLPDVEGRRGRDHDRPKG